ncbi:MAG: SIS domain-containing protein [Spirochaetota bacterium]
MNILDTSINEHLQVVNSLSGIKKDIEALATKAVDTLKSGGKILIMGNGGSAADSQHMAAEIIVRFKTERRALPAIALSTDSSILTAAANDYSFDLIFARQIEALASANDLVLGISTSGKSPNVLKGIESAKKAKCATAALLGCGGGEIGRVVDTPVIVPSNNTPRVQECHILIIHTICQIIDEAFNES